MAPGSLRLLLKFWKFCATLIKLYPIAVNSTSLQFTEVLLITVIRLLFLMNGLCVVLDNTNVIT